MPDQSLDVPADPKGAGDPSDTTANHPEAAQQSSVEANVTQASEGQTQQADVTINKDPIVGSAESRSDDYDDEEVWPYRRLQSEAKSLDLDASGKREEIVARLRGTGPAAGSSGASDTPRGDLDPTNVENGGIQTTSAGVDHASVLQGLSNDRRAQQLAAVNRRG